MAAANPETFTLTDAEAAAIQSLQMAKQATLARKGPVLRLSSIAAPFIVVAVIWLVDITWYDGAMPVSLYVTLMAVFVAGMIFQTAGFWLNLLASKKRLRSSTRQVYEPRTVRLRDDCIEQSIPTATTLQRWTGVTSVEMQNGMIQVWAGNLLVVPVPVRAFPSQADAQAFFEACRARVPD